MYPVEFAYLEEPITDYIRMAVEVTWKINLQVRSVVRNLCAAFHSKRKNCKHVAGDILVFLTGREDIERFLEAITELIPTCEANSPKVTWS